MMKATQQGQTFTVTPQQMKDSFSAAMGKTSSQLNEAFNFVFSNMTQSLEQAQAKIIEQDKIIAEYTELYGTITEEMRKKLKVNKDQTPKPVYQVQTTQSKKKAKK